MSGNIEITNHIAEPKREITSITDAKLSLRIDFSRRIPELDGLRGVAIAMVVFMHYVWFAIVARPPALLGYVNTLSRPLWSAVDLFFLLSGFLIGGNLLDTRDSPNYFSVFYIRRFCRVLPIYFLFMALVGIAYRYVYLPVGAPLDWVFAGKLPWYAYISFAQNLWISKWNTSGSSILAITWAFAVEVQFYMVIPALIRFVRRSALPYIFVSGFVLAPLVRLFIVFRFRSSLYATYALLPCRMDSLFLGLLCAYYLREREVWNWLVKRRSNLWIVFFTLLAIVPALNTKGIPVTLLWITVGYGWMSLLYATAMILALTSPRSFLSRGLRWRWLTGLGTISYGVYLFHSGIYGFCMWLLTGHASLLATWKDFGVTLLAAAISIALGRLSWLYFEKPIVRWSRDWPPSGPAGVEPTAQDVNTGWAVADDAPKVLDAG
jgi:peptidoglycan/LPS O-acetylase OafA/YrhL